MVNSPSESLVTMLQMTGAGVINPAPEERFQPGDLVKFTRVFRVTGVDHVGIGGKDEKTGAPVYFSADKNYLGQAAKLQLVHRPKKKPAVGAVLTADEVRAVQWKRGTVLVDGDGAALMLAAGGDWRNVYGGYFTFTHLVNTNYTVTYLPKEN